MEHLDDKQQYLSTQEAARSIGVTVQHLRLLARQGQVKAKKIGRDWVFEAAVLANWSNSRHKSTTSFSQPNEPIRLQHGTPIWRTDSPKSTRYALLRGDAVEQLSNLPSASIDTCLTSPPYWLARDYEEESQIGLEQNVDDYVERLVQVFNEVRRVLTPKGTAWLNLGDCYINNVRSTSPAWQKNKQLALLPFRVAIALQNSGWYIRNTVVWRKPNAMPASVRDRLTNMWEPVFLLSTSENYYFDLDAIRIKHTTDDNIERKRAESDAINGKAMGQSHLRRWLNSPRHRATIDGLKEIRRRPNAPKATELAAFLRHNAEQRGITIKSIAEQLGQPFERVRHYFRTDEIGSRRPPEDTWERLKELLDLDNTFDDAMAVEIGDNVFRNHPNGKNPGDVQSIPITATGFSHFAVMPARLASWCLRATLPGGGIALDPFAGIGTTGKIALELGGRFVGIDIREDYLRLAHDILRTTSSQNARENRKK